MKFAATNKAIIVSSQAKSNFPGSPAADKKLEPKTLIYALMANWCI